jgi:hypothetical protein
LLLGLRRVRGVPAVLAAGASEGEVGRLHASRPAGGACCSCGYGGEWETECPARGDGTHCVHWWDGPGDGSSQRTSTESQLEGEDHGSD